MVLSAVAKQVALPALLLDMDAFEHNCKKIASRANGKKIRIATKSIRSVDVLNKILESDSTFQGLMCFSPREAVFLANKGFDDLLLGYPCWDKEAISEIAQLNKQGKKIICMVDAEEQVNYLSQILTETGGEFYLCIDVDMSTSFPKLHFGVRRSPLNDKQSVLKLANKIKQASDLHLVGVMGYEAQIAGVGDNAPSKQLKNKLIRFMKRRSIKEIEARRKSVIDALEDAGFSLSFVNGGGTGSLHTTATEDVVTEVTVGSGFYSPALFDYYQDFIYKPSLYFALPIVRKPTENIYTCHGGGYIASGPHGEDKVPKIVYPPHGKLIDLEGAGEVQTPVYYENENLEIGDPIIFRHAKAGEVCERFNDIICLRDTMITKRYKTYRGEGVSFL